MRLLLIGALLIFAVNVFSQENIEVSFKISNPTGSPISNAEVRILNIEKMGNKGVDGLITFNQLSKGKYTIEISAAGFSTLVQKIDINKKQEFSITLEYDYKQLSDVVVNATKKESDFYRIPGAVTTFDSKQIRDFRIWEIGDLSGLVPNMNLSQSGDNRNVAFIRGIGTTSYEQAVATYIDGVAQFNLDTYLPQLNDIASIEILRGPQGTLYGRNSMAGVININTKKPSNTTSFNADLSVAGFGQKRFNGALRFPILKNKIFGSVSFLSDLKDGYFTNDFLKKSFDKQNQTGVNAQVKYLINDKWAVQLDHKTYKAKNEGAFPLVGDITELLKNPFRLSQNQVAPMRDNTSNSSLVLKYKGEKVNLFVQNSWQQNYRYYENTIDADFSPYDIVGIYNNYGKDFNRVRVFTQDIKLSSSENDDSRFKWVAGTYLYSQQNPTKQATAFGKDAGFIGVPDKNFAIISTNVSKNKGIAFYGNGTLSLTNKFTITGGLRIDRESREMTVSGAYEKKPNPVFVTNPDTTGKTSYSAVSPKIGIQYNRTENSIYYLTYNRGFRTGGLTSISSDPSSIPLIAYKPEYSNTFEAGLKGEQLNKRIKFALAVFYSKVSDIQVPSLVLPDAITVVKNAGKLESKGLEYEIAAIPVNGLTINYSGGLTDSRYLTFTTGQNGAQVDLAGKRQIFTPVLTNLLTMQFQHKLDKKGKASLVLRGEYKIMGRQYFDVANTIEQKMYRLLNYKAGIQTKNVDVFVWVRNAGNVKYIDYAYDFGAAHLGNPKIVGATVSVKL
jgi:iron complex outermembrane receptor protein